MYRALILALPLTLFAFIDASEANSDGIIAATQLGAVLAGEKPCGLSFDKGAVEAYINTRVPASDMSFGSMLQMMVEGQKITIQEMSSTTRAAFCAQTTRVARFNSFIR